MVYEIMIRLNWHGSVDFDIFYCLTKTVFVVLNDKNIEHNFVEHFAQLCGCAIFQIIFLFLARFLKKVSPVMK